MAQKKDKKRAAALQYDPFVDQVPRLSAYGEGYVAERMIEKAQESSVPVVFDAGLASLFASLRLGDEIPPELYQAVAQILVFISQSDERFAQKLSGALPE